MSEQVVIEPGAVGYIFRTENLDSDWQYIGQSTRLDPEHVNGYYGSGVHIREALAQNGSEGIKKYVLMTATSELDLHYLESLQIAEARAAGSVLLNGDFGGPLPFPTFQRLLWEEAPAVMAAVGDAVENRDAFLRTGHLVDGPLEQLKKQDD